MKINPYQTNDPLKKTTIDKNEDPTEVDDPTGIDEPTNAPKIDGTTDDIGSKESVSKKPAQDTVEYDVIDSGELDEMIDGMNGLEALDKLKELVSRCADSVSKIADFVKQKSTTDSKKADEINSLSDEIQKDSADDGTGKGKNSAYSLDIPTGEDTTKDPEETTETDDKLSEKQTKLETLSTEFEDSKAIMEKAPEDLDNMKNSLGNIVNKATEKVSGKKAIKNFRGLKNLKEGVEKVNDIILLSNNVADSISTTRSDIDELTDDSKAPTKIAENTLEKIEEKEKEKEKQ